MRGGSTAFPSREQGGRGVRGEARRGGLTLVEVIVAVVLLSVGLLASVSMVSLAARTLGEARRISLAAAAAESVADSLLRSGWSDAVGIREYTWGVLRWQPGGRPGEVIVTALDSGAPGGGVGVPDTTGGSILVELFLRLPEPPTASDGAG